MKLRPWAQVGETLIPSLLRTVRPPIGKRKIDAEIGWIKPLAFAKVFLVTNASTTFFLQKLEDSSTIFGDYFAKI